MLEALIHADRSLFSALNGAHADFLDPIMAFFSEVWAWIPLYVGIIVALFWVKQPGLSPQPLVTRRQHTVFGLCALAALLLCFGLCDQLGGLGKDSFERLRPCWDPELAPTVHLLEGRGSRFGFPSNHAANCFGLAVLSSLIFKHRLYTGLMLFWAACVGYSRIYVGKHFPLDVVCGALLGALVAWGIAFCLRRILASRTCARWAKF
jgi:undecaprenyl-diphosphatase